MGIDFKKNISKRQEKTWREKREEEIIEKLKKRIDGKIDRSDLYCIVCGDNIDLHTLSCQGCGMEFNMEDKEARHMISIMIGMAWSDGVLDENERACLSEYIDKIDLPPGTKSRLKKEVFSPRKLKNIVRWIKTPQGKRNTIRMVTASGMVSKWDTEELMYLEEVKKALNLKPGEADIIIQKTEEYLKPMFDL